MNSNAASDLARVGDFARLNARPSDDRFAFPNNASIESEALAGHIGHCCAFFLDCIKQRIGKMVTHSDSPIPGPPAFESISRRSAIGVFGTAIAMVNVSSLSAAHSQSQQTQGTQIMDQHAMSQNSMSQKTLGDIISGGGLLVVAQWQAKEGQADAVAAILRRFLPQAQSDVGTKIFLIGQGKQDPAQFLFYELFVDEAAFAAHQASAYFKTLIAEQALPLLAKRERAQYSLL